MDIDCGLRADWRTYLFLILCLAYSLSIAGLGYKQQELGTLIGKDTDIVTTENKMSLDLSLMELQFTEVGSHNITHNCKKLAVALNLYVLLWDSELGGAVYSNETRAKDAQYRIDAAITELRDNMEKYRQYEPDNGWGTCEDFLKFLEDLSQDCAEHPEAFFHADW